MEVIIMKGTIFIIIFIIPPLSFMRRAFPMTVTKKLPDAMWLLIVDALTDGQVCSLSLGVVDKRRQILINDFRVSRRLTLRYH